MEEYERIMREESLEVEEIFQMMRNEEWVFILCLVDIYALVFYTIGLVMDSLSHCQTFCFVKPERTSLTIRQLYGYEMLKMSLKFGYLNYFSYLCIVQKNTRLIFFT